MKIRRSAHSAASRILGPTILTDYARAVRMRGRSVPYEPRSMWTSRYERILAGGPLTDASTIKEGADPLRVRYHYNAVENAILEHALRLPVSESPKVLDVGVGAGHWIGFYRDVFAASEVVGVEISASAAAALAAAYEPVSGVTILEADVADPTFDVGQRFDLVNAVDVLFHIVDDASWRRAVKNLGAHLEPGGRLVVAEHVALITHDMGFRRVGSAAPDGVKPDPGVSVVTKRARSLRDWRSCADESGLAILTSARIRKSRTLLTPANRLLVLGRRR